MEDKRMIDGHIHIERGPYTLDWIQQFVNQAVKMNISEIRLLEHCYRFEEFMPMYDDFCMASEFNNTWFHSRAGVHKLQEYLDLIKAVREKDRPVDIKFGLEVCYFEGKEGFVKDLTKDLGLDFLLGSIHFIDNFAYDLQAEHWIGKDVDHLYKRYFEIALSLASSGVYSGMGHPDAIKLFGHHPSYSLTDAYRKLAKALASTNTYADQNSGVARRCPTTGTLGMDYELVQILKENGVKIVTSSDAHCPEDVGALIKELNELIS